MRNRRLVVGLAALACAIALPAAASAHKGQPEKSRHGAKAAHGHPGNRHGENAAGNAARLLPAAGQTAKGIVQLKQHAGALSVVLVVKHLTPGAFYAAHVHTGTCATPNAPVALTLPDIYADEDGVATLVTTLPTAAGASYVAGGYSVDVHAGLNATPQTAVIACGDVLAKPIKAEAKVRLKGTDVHGRAEVKQKAGDVTVWIALRGLTPGDHAVHLHAGTCAMPGSIAADLGVVTADADGNATAKLTATASALVVGTGYSVDVHAGLAAAPGAIVACGDQYSTRGHH